MVVAITLEAVVVIFGIVGIAVNCGAAVIVVASFIINCFDADIDKLLGCAWDIELGPTNCNAVVDDVTAIVDLGAKPIVVVEVVGFEADTLEIDGTKVPVAAMLFVTVNKTVDVVAEETFSTVVPLVFVKERAFITVLENVATGAVDVVIIGTVEVIAITAVDVAFVAEVDATVPILLLLLVETTVVITGLPVVDKIVVTIFLVVVLTKGVVVVTATLVELTTGTDVLIAVVTLVFFEIDAAALIVDDWTVPEVDKIVDWFVTTFKLELVDDMLVVGVRLSFELFSENILIFHQSNLHFPEIDNSAKRC
jgi:hypothetical protein